MSTAESRTQTHWIHLPQGRLFAQSWSPAQPGASAALAPLVLLHDSLGCVAMWRDLPAQLAQATGRSLEHDAVYAREGVMLERSQIAERLLTAMAGLFGSLRGGLAISVMLVGAGQAVADGGYV